MKRADDQTEQPVAGQSLRGKRSRTGSIFDAGAAAIIGDEMGAADAAEASLSSTEREALLRLLAEIGTGLWRLRRSLAPSETSVQQEELRRACRHLESVMDALSEGGVRIRDHTGEAVPEGGIYALRTVAYDPTPGLAFEQVIETIKPTIYFKEQMIQMGEVIVGTPAKPSD